MLSERSERQNVPLPLDPILVVRSKVVPLCLMTLMFVDDEAISVDSFPLSILLIRMFLINIINQNLKRTPSKVALRFFWYTACLHCPKSPFSAENDHMTLFLSLLT